MREFTRVKLGHDLRRKRRFREAGKTIHKIPTGSVSAGCGLDWGQWRNMWSMQDMLRTISAGRTWYQECLLSD